MQMAFFVSVAMDAIEAFEFAMRINQNLYGNLFDANERTNDVGCSGRRVLCV